MYVYDTLFLPMMSPVILNLIKIRRVVLEMKSVNSRAGETMCNVIYEGPSESKFTVDMFWVARFQAFAAAWLNFFARSFVIDVVGQSIGPFSKNQDLFQNHRLETILRCTTTMKSEDLLSWLLYFLL